MTRSIASHEVGLMNRKPSDSGPVVPCEKIIFEMPEGLVNEMDELIPGWYEDRDQFINTAILKHLDLRKELASVAQVVDDNENQAPIIDIEIRIKRCVVSNELRHKVSMALEPFLVEIGDMIQEDMIKSRIVTSE